jgi:phage shock protein PspC (stress-responsive transcriptional regulator)
METTVNISSTKRLERPTSGRRLAGVCAGLGQYFDLSPAVYRLGFIVLTMLGGAGILVYLAAVLVIPDEGKEESIAGEALAERRDKPWPLIGIGLVGAALAVLLARATLWPVAGSGWVLILIIGLGVLWASHGSSRGRVLLRVVIGTVATLILAVIAAGAIAVSWFDVSLSDGVGNRSYQPNAAAALQPNYHLGVGKLQLDLTNVGPITSDTVVHAKVAIGEVLVTVPQGLDVVVNGHAKLGSLDILSAHHRGRNTSLTSGHDAKLVIDASVGAGEIRVERAAQ